MQHGSFSIVDDILYIDHEDGAESFAKEKSNENESLTTSVSDNTFYDTDGASNFYREKFKARSHQNDNKVAPPINPMTDKRDAHNTGPLSDWASTGDDTSFYDDQSGALLSVVGHEFRSITPIKTSRGAYSNQLSNIFSQFKIVLCFFKYYETKHIHLTLNIPMPNHCHILISETNMKM